MSLLEVHGLTRHFGGLRAVAGLDFSVRQGEILGLIGPNGAGKTTVFNLVTGFVRPTAGEIRFEGRSLVGLRPHAVTARGLARTFQVVKPFPGLTVLENATLAAFPRHPRRRDAETRALEVLERMGLAPKARVLASQLTLMEQKRLEMARALATEPRLLLLDEPMGGLNASEVDVASEIVSRLRATGLTVVLVEHVMKAIMSISDRVVVIHHGEKIAEGPPAQVVKDAGVISAYFGRRAGA
ncbi:MAG TPA: ABC transporter ATP-binding protein [Anaeromyxobacteraceae bacterium]|nr:ABC transporter ATP-binding protein [Anaeromyxobacteraceae bacterium]